MRTNHSPVLAAIALCALAACSNTPSQSTLTDIRTGSNPTDRAQRTLTTFTPALRCMDDMMFRRGTRDVSLMMEELRDATQRVPISARDMMTSAMSDISRRSRGVRLSVFGTDQQNLLQFLQTAQKNTPFAVVPQFSIRGTVSQMDEAVQRNSAGFGATLAESVFGVRFASDARFAIMAMDAAVVSTDTMTLLPGVVSKNTTVLVSRDASAEEGQARLVRQDIGLVFSMASSRADGPAQAARNMIELATVELVGRLIKMPYWQCLGMPDDDPEVLREMEDWYLSMDEPDRVQYFKTRMREARLYDGPIDGQTGPDVDQAVRAYRQALGLPPSGGLDLLAFQQSVTRVVPRQPAVPRLPDSRPEPSVPALSVQVDRPGTTAPQLQVQASRAGYVYCYSQDKASGRMQRIFPNRIQTDPFVAPGQRIALPGRDRFKLSKSARYACVHAPQEVYADLPAPLRWGDFEDIRLNSFEEIQQQFSKASGLPVALVQAHPRQR